MAWTKATSQDGYEATLDILHVQRSELGYLAGDWGLIRESFLARLPDLIQRKFPAWKSHTIAPPDGPLPTYVVMAALTADPLDEQNDMSGLVLCWFENDLERPMSELLQVALSQIVWADLAKDGRF